MPRHTPPRSTPAATLSPATVVIHDDTVLFLCARCARPAARVYVGGIRKALAPFGAMLTPAQIRDRMTAAGVAVSCADLSCEAGVAA